MYGTPTGPALEQGDILDGCPLAAVVDDPPGGAPPNAATTRARVVILTQTCDLAQGKAPRVLAAVCHPAQLLIDRGVLKPTAVRDQIRVGKVYGWYFLPADAAIGLPESLVDLRDLHTVPRAVLDGLVAAGRRVCRVLTPYREHLAQHFAVTYMRVALPDPYPTAP